MAIKDSRSEIRDEGKPGDYRIKKFGRLEVHYLPTVLVALNIELTRHPDAVEAIAAGPGGMAAEWWSKLATLAAYYNILLEDTYTAEDLERVAGIVLERMRKPR